MAANRRSNNRGLVKLPRVIYLTEHDVSPKEKNDEDLCIMIWKKISRIHYEVKKSKVQNNMYSVLPFDNEHLCLSKHVILEQLPAGTGKKQDGWGY